MVTTPVTDPDRVLTTLVRSMLADGLEVSEVSAALDIDPAMVRELRHWHPAEKFSREESARFRDLLRRAAWKLPYWSPSSDGRLVLLPEETRVTRRMERDAQYRSRVTRGKIPEMLDNPQAES